MVGSFVSFTPPFCTIEPEFRDVYSARPIHDDLLSVCSNPVSQVIALGFMDLVPKWFRPPRLTKISIPDISVLLSHAFTTYLPSQSLKPSETGQIDVQDCGDGLSVADG